MPRRHRREPAPRPRAARLARGPGPVDRRRRRRRPERLRVGVVGASHPRPPPATRTRRHLRGRRARGARRRRRPRRSRARGRARPRDDQPRPRRARAPPTSSTAHGRRRSCTRCCAPPCVEHLAPFDRSQLHTRAADTLAAADPRRPGGDRAPPPRGRTAGSRRSRGRSSGAPPDSRFAGAPRRPRSPSSTAPSPNPPTPRERAAVLRELGEAELRDGDGAAVAHLEQALELTDDPVARAATGHVTRERPALPRRMGGSDRAVPAGTGGRRDRTTPISPHASKPTCSSRPRSTTAPRDMTSPRYRSPRSASARRRLGGGALRSRSRCSRRSGAGATRSRTSSPPRSPTVRSSPTETSDSIAAVQAVDALIFVDRLDDALAFARDMVIDGERRASVLGVVAGLTHRGFAELRLGQLADAEADCRAALDLATEHGLAFTIPFIAAYLSTTLLAIGAPARANEVISAVDPRVELEHTVAPPTFLEARGWCAPRSATTMARRTTSAPWARRVSGCGSPTRTPTSGGSVSPPSSDSTIRRRRSASHSTTSSAARRCARSARSASRCGASPRSPTATNGSCCCTVRSSTSSGRRHDSSWRDPCSTWEPPPSAPAVAPTRARALLQSLQLATECGATALAAQRPRRGPPDAARVRGDRGRRAAPR